MSQDVDVTSWVAGWTALGFIIAYGAVVIGSSVRTARARESIPSRILVTGSRGKSGAVRLIHAVMNPTEPAYGKITGTAARELFPDGHEEETTRIGSTSSSEMPRAVRRAAKSGAALGIFECMAITPSLVRLIQRSHVQAQTVVIPAIRLDHLEAQGLGEVEIATNTIDAIDGCETIIAGVDQPEVQQVFRDYCQAHDIEFVLVRPDETTPECPGHHPTNVAIALEVASRRGVPREEAIARLQAVSFEPGSTEFYRVSLDDGVTMDVVDLSGANDPQSAWDAITRYTPADADVVPILVNRWERPLRSMAFFGSFRGRFPVIGVMGSIGRWMATRHGKDDYRLTRDHEESRYFPVTRSMVTHLDQFAQRIRQEHGDHSDHLVVLLLENTHHPAADALRQELERSATRMTLGSEAVGR